MQTNVFQKVGLIALLMLFVVSKWNALALPYFWDEAWSYIPAISAMANEVPCLLPDCINAELYRGHPLFFYFLASGWMSLVASSPFSMHVFALFISILAVVSFYRLALMYVTPFGALLGTSLLILQETFYVQSSFVLPEVLLMLLTVESIRNYLLQRKGWFLLFAGLLCLTKETGVVVVCGFILFHLISTRTLKKDSWWVYVSILPAFIFFGLQKIALGWFFYPLHIGQTDLSLGALIPKFEIIMKHLFLQQGRMIVLVGTGMLLIIQGFVYHNKKNIAYLIAISIALVYLLLTGNITSLLLYLGTHITYISITIRFSKVEKHFFLLSGTLLVLFLGFTVSNFLMIRYLVPIYPLLILLLLMLIHKSIPDKSLYRMTLSIMLILNFIFSMLYNVSHKLWHDDASINYTNAVKAHQQAVDYCEQQEWFDINIFTHFLLQQNLTKPDLGYLKGKPFLNATYTGEIKAEDEVLIFSCIELDESKYEMIKGNPGYRLDRRFEAGNAWTEIYLKGETGEE